MGAIANALVAFTQPLLDQTDGSLEHLEKAYALGQICWNLALLPPDEREGALRRMLESLHLDGEAFEIFRHDIYLPMIRRHEEMFPQMHRRASSGPVSIPLALPPRTEGRPRAGRNSPCPCNSGRKYKHCCGR